MEKIPLATDVLACHSCGMKLSHWMNLHGISAAEMSRQLDMKSTATVWRYLRDKRKPGHDVIRRVAEITGGQVTANDWIHGSDT